MSCRVDLTGPAQLKVDGFFGLLARLSAQTSLTSRSGKALGQHFPELLGAAEGLPRGTILAGEIVMAGEGGPSFAALQDRLAGGVRLAPIAAEFIVFDLAALAGEDYTHLDFGARCGAVLSPFTV